MIHKALSGLALVLRLVSAANWLSQYRMRIWHILGKLNVFFSDALSRHPTWADNGTPPDQDVLADAIDISTFVVSYRKLYSDVGSV